MRSSLRLQSYVSSLRVVTRKMPVVVQDLPPHDSGSKSKSGAQKHCILLHGWASEASAMQSTRDALRELPQANTWRFWDVTYDTAWTPFTESAQKITGEFEALKNQ